MPEAWTIRNTSPELAASAADAAILSFATLEPKAHLPIGLDLILADAFSEDFAARFGTAYALPPIPFGSSDATGAVRLDSDTLWAIVEDLVESVGRQRFERVVVLNFAATNWAIKPVVRELNLRRGWAKVVWVEPKQFGRELLRERFPDVSDYHAGAFDTSLALRLCPALVAERPDDREPDVGREFIDYVGLDALAPTGVWGRPRLATDELGGELYDHMLEETTRYIKRAYDLWRTDG